jgi:alcohol dehydrogenase YqhD (iron-dependent ADH family)
MERRNNFRFDYSINISNLIAVVLLLFTIINYGSQVISYLHNVNLKVNIMWAHFVKTNPEAQFEYDQK